MTDFAYMPLVEVAGLLEKRELSPVELTRRLLERIDRVDTRTRRVPGHPARRPHRGQRPRLHGGHPDLLRLYAHAGLAARL